jgi:hypothetical protein
MTLLAIAAFALPACSDDTGMNVHVIVVDDAGAGETPDAAPDASSIDAHTGEAAPDAHADANDAGNTCEVYGAPGECITVSACTALGDHTSYTGHCSGPSTIECCIKTPNVADNPPIPAGYKLLSQSQVTPEMTTWAVDILHDPVTYPMFATTTKTFGTLMVLARVEWHPPDFQNSVVHRGVTLYEPI